MKNSGIKNIRFAALLIVALGLFSSCGQKPEAPVSSGPASSAENPSSSEISGDVNEPENNEVNKDDINKEPETDDTQKTEEPENPDDGESKTEEPEKPYEPEKPNNQNKPEKTDKTEKPAKPSTPSAPAKQPTAVADPSLSSSWEIVDAVAKAGQTYYNEYFGQIRLVTKNGYLYNFSGKEKIDVSFLVSNGYLSSKYLNSGCELLLLNSSNFNYDTVKLNGSESGLTVFAAMKSPKDNSYLIKTGKSEGGSLSASQYFALLNGYNQEHGTVGRLFAATDTYNRIINFVSMYEGKYEDYCIRSVYADDKYSLVTLSPKSNTARIRMYILKKSNGIWEVVYSGLENEHRLPIAVNKKLPDFNLNMLPMVSPADYNSINAYNDDIISRLIGIGTVSSSSEVKYICSTSNYGYVVLNNEIKYVFTNSSGNWSANQVASCDDAERFLKGRSSTAPLFIVWDK